MSSQASADPTTRVIYDAHFEAGDGAVAPHQGWTVAKNTDTYSQPWVFHQNALGHYGIGEALDWQPSGGRQGGFVSSPSPWYWDDNHGEFYWFHIVYRVSTTQDIGIEGVKLTNSRVRIGIRGRNLAVSDEPRVPPSPSLRELKLFFWLQGESGDASYYEHPVLVNWAYVGAPLEDALWDGAWHDVEFQLTPDESRWTQMGLIKGGLARKIRVLQSRTMADGSLRRILDGKHWNFGLLLCGVDPRDLPSGNIDVDHFSIVSDEA